MAARPDRVVVRAQWATWVRDAAPAGPDVLAAIDRRFPAAAPTKVSVDGSRWSPVERPWKQVTTAWSDAADPDRDDVTSVYWRCRRPGVDGRVSFPWWHRRDAADGIPAAELEVAVAMAALIGSDAAPRKAFEDLVVEVAESIGAFFARVIVEVDHADPTAVEAMAGAPGLLQQDHRWLGIPRYPAWLIWLGAHLRRAAGVRPSPRGSAGALLRLADGPDLVDPMRSLPDLDDDLFRRQRGVRTRRPIERLGVDKAVAPRQPVPYHAPRR
jgi:hypothetical protein